MCERSGGRLRHWAIHSDRCGLWGVMRACVYRVCAVCVTRRDPRDLHFLSRPARPRPVACSLPTPPDPRPAHTRAGRRARSALTLPAESPGLLTGSRPRTRGSHAAVRDPAGRRALSRPARPNWIQYTRPGRTYECILVALSSLASRSTAEFTRAASEQMPAHSSANHPAAREGYEPTKMSSSRGSWKGPSRRAARMRARQRRASRRPWP